MILTITNNIPAQININVRKKKHGCHTKLMEIMNFPKKNPLKINKIKKKPNKIFYFFKAQ